MIVSSDSPVASAVRCASGHSPRFGMAYFRLLWKEWRAQRPLLVAVLVSIVGLEGLLLWLGQNEPWREPTFGTIATVMAAAFALGSGAMAYANEREEGTWDYLRRIAAPSGAVCSAKMFVGLFGTLLVTSVAWWSVSWLSPSLRLELNFPFTRALLLSALTVVMAQTVSALVKSVLWALGLATLFGLPTFLFFMSRFLAQPHRFWSDASVMNAVEVGAAVTLFVALGTLQFWLAHRWLQYRERNPLARLAALWHPLGSRGAVSLQQSPQWRAFESLLAREWMLARPWLWTGLLVGFIPCAEFVNRFQGRLDRLLFVTLPFVLTGMGLLALAPTMLGVWAYQHDQRDLRLRFLADRGVSPGLVWLSKHVARLLVLGGLLLAMLLAFSLSKLVIASGQRNVFPLSNDWLLFLLMCGWYLLVSYSAGQFVGQVARSPIIAVFLSSVLTGLLVAWDVAIQELFYPFVLHPVPVLAQVLPACVLLFATWRHARDWLEERRTLRAWSALAATAVIPLTLIYGGVGLYRMASAPRAIRIAPKLSQLDPTVHQLELKESQARTTMAEIVNEYNRAYAAASAEIKDRTRKQVFVARSKSELEELHRNKAIANIWLAGASNVTERPHDVVLLQLIQQSLAVEAIEATQILRELHFRHFAKTCELLVAVAKQSDFVWPLAVGFTARPNEPSLRTFSLLLQLQAMIAGQEQRWEESLELSLATWRLVRQRAAGIEPPTVMVAPIRQVIQEAQEQLLRFAQRCRSPELIRRLIRELASSPTFWPSSRPYFEAQWAMLDDSLATDGISLSKFWELIPYRSPWLTHLFPWEVWRARREIAALKLPPILVWESLEDVLVKGQTNRITSGSVQSHEQSAKARPPRGVPKSRGTPIDTTTLINAVLETEVRHRATIQLLALIAWRHEHGQLPDRLHDLVGTVLDRLPLHPVTGKPFELVRTDDEAKTLGLTAPAPLLLTGLPTLAGTLRVVRADGQGDEWIAFESRSPEPFLPALLRE